MLAGATQFFFVGGALNEAVRSVKEHPEYLVSESATVAGMAADFTGLECRWNAVRPPAGAVHLVLVQTRPTLPLLEQLALLDRCLVKIAEIYGQAAERHPIPPGSYRLSSSPWQIARELRLKAPTLGPWRRLRAWVVAWIGNELAGIGMRWGFSFWGVDWRRYYKEVSVATDCLKVDDVFRVVLAGRPSQLASLHTWLESERASGRLWYGTHASPQAIMTCMVMDRLGKHFHFVDGSDGGYALAAVALKAQLSDRM
jgi:hypothetical protein